jgi:hypothetical protein
MDELGEFMENNQFVVRNKQTFLFGSVGALVVQKLD